MNKEKADMIIYTTEDGLTKVETTFDGDTVWLSVDQMAELFQRNKSTISRHIKNIFTEGGQCAAHNQIIAKVPNVISNSYVISSKDCTSRGDGYHFNTAGYRLLGQRYGETM